MTIYDIVESPGKVCVHVSTTVGPPPPFPEAPDPQLSFSHQKHLTHIEFPDGKTTDIECVYFFTLVELLHSGSSHKIKALADFVDSVEFSRMGGDADAAVGGEL